LFAHLLAHLFACLLICLLQERDEVKKCIALRMEGDRMCCAELELIKEICIG
jgi:hypothetical protein